MATKKVKTRNFPDWYFDCLGRIGQNLSDIMALRGYSKFDLADVSGVSVKTIERILYPNAIINRFYNPGYITLARLAYGLQVKVEDLIE